MSIACFKKVFRGTNHDLTFRLESAGGLLRLPWLGFRLVEDVEEKPELYESKCRNVIRGDVWYLSTKSAVSGFSGRYYFRGNLGIRLVEEVEEEVNVCHRKFVFV